MPKPALAAVFFCIIITGCSSGTPAGCAKQDILKIADFELSPDQEKIVFSAITPVGNLDIWVVDIDGKNLRKLTFQDRSPTNHIAKFFKKHRWRNFFEIDMSYPKWTEDGRIAFCQRLSKVDNWSGRTVSRRYWTINSNGTDKRPQAGSDKITKEQQPPPLNKFKFSDRSEKYRAKILLKNNDLWVTRDGAAGPQKLIQ